MKTRHLVVGLLGIIALAAAFELGFRLQRFVHPTSNGTRLITISASPAPDTGCEVDFPVAFLRYGQHHSVQWASSDHGYWVSFLTTNPPDNPLVPADDPVVIPLGSSSKTYQVKAKAGYYMYAIFDHDPTINNQNPCKAATDDRDTGLNVKR
jgi:hypothetical protein